MNIPSTIFDFSEYVYEVIFEQVDANFWEKLFTGKEKKMRFYIRQMHKVKRPYNSLYDNVLLHYCKLLKQYEFPITDIGFNNPVYWDNLTVPSEIITRAKYGNSPDTVVFSSKDLP
jgi:hypothetical protein